MIGELKEKSLHSFLKNFYAPSINQEVKVGPYFADIKNDDEIIEIQTQGFDKLRDKLDYYLKDYKVRLVYPISHIKTLIVSDNDLVKTRKSPKVGSIYDAIKELYKIKSFLGNPNLKLDLVLIDTIEKRVKNNSRKGYLKIENYPKEIYKIIKIERVDDYNIFIDDLGEEFTSLNLASKKVSKRNASILLNILRSIGIIEIIGKNGRAYLYRRKHV